MAISFHFSHTFVDLIVSVQSAVKFNTSVLQYFFLDMISFSTNLKGNLSNWCRNFVFVCWPDRTENAKQMNVWFQSFFFLCLKRLFDKQMTRQGVIWKVLHNKLDFTLITNRTYLLRCMHVWTWKSGFSFFVIYHTLKIVKRVHILQ